MLYAQTAGESAIVKPLVLAEYPDITKINAYNKEIKYLNEDYLRVIVFDYSIENQGRRLKNDMIGFFARARYIEASEEENIRPAYIQRLRAENPADPDHAAFYRRLLKEIAKFIFSLTQHRYLFGDQKGTNIHGGNFRITPSGHIKQVGDLDFIEVIDETIKEQALLSYSHFTKDQFASWLSVWVSVVWMPMNSADLKRFSNVEIRQVVDEVIAGHSQSHPIHEIGSGPMASSSGVTSRGMRLNRQDLDRFGIRYLTHGNQADILGKEGWPFVIKQFYDNRLFGITVRKSVEAYGLAHTSLGGIIEDFVPVEIVAEDGQVHPGVIMREVTLGNFDEQLRILNKFGRIDLAKDFLSETVVLVTATIARGFFPYDLKFDNFAVNDQRRMVLLDAGLFNRELKKQSFGTWATLFNKNISYLHNALHSDELSGHYIQTLERHGLSPAHIVDTVNRLADTQKAVLVTDITSEIERSFSGLVRVSYPPVGAPGSDKSDASVDNILAGVPGISTSSPVKLLERRHLVVELAQDIRGRLQSTVSSPVGRTRVSSAAGLKNIKRHPYVMLSLGLAVGPVVAYQRTSKKGLRLEQKKFKGAIVAAKTLNEWEIRRLRRYGAQGYITLEGNALNPSAIAASARGTPWVIMEDAKKFNALSKVENSGIYVIDSRSEVPVVALDDYNIRAMFEHRYHRARSQMIRATTPEEAISTWVGFKRAIRKIEAIAKLKGQPFDMRMARGEMNYLVNHVIEPFRDQVMERIEQLQTALSLHPGSVDFNDARLWLERAKRLGIVTEEFEAMLDRREAAQPREMIINDFGIASYLTGLGGHQKGQGQLDELMTQLSLLKPVGFIVSNTAFIRYLKDNGLFEQIQEALTEDIKGPRVVKVRSLWFKSRFPKQLGAIIAKAYLEVLNESVSVINASALMESGLHERTYKARHVRPADRLTAVRRTWARFFNSDVLDYISGQIRIARQSGRDFVISTTYPSLIIRQQVRAQASGFIATVNTAEKNWQQMIINVAPETSSHWMERADKVDADRITLEKESEAILHVYPGADRTAVLLRPDEIHRLAVFAKAFEKFIGRPLLWNLRRTTKVISMF